MGQRCEGGEGKEEDCEIVTLNVHIRLCSLERGVT